MVTRGFDCLSRSTFVNESIPEYTLAMDAIYPVSTEQIGKPDPLARDYVGTYSPPALYAMAVIDEPSALDVRL